MTRLLKGSCMVETNSSPTGNRTPFWEDLNLKTGQLITIINFRPDLGLVLQMDNGRFEELITTVQGIDHFLQNLYGLITSSSSIVCNGLLVEKLFIKN